MDLDRIFHCGVRVSLVPFHELRLNLGVHVHVGAGFIELGVTRLDRPMDSAD